MRHSSTACRCTGQIRQMEESNCRFNSKLKGLAQLPIRESPNSLHPIDLLEFVAVVLGKVLRKTRKQKAEADCGETQKECMCISKLKVEKQ